MQTKLENLSRNLYCLRSELLGPIVSMHGGYKLIIKKTINSMITNDLVPLFGDVCSRVNEEISSLPENIDLDSPTNAAKQLHTFAKKMEKNAKVLSDLVNQINKTDFHPDDPDLDSSLKNIISNGLSRFQIYIQDIKVIQEEVLTQYDGYINALRIDTPE